MNLRLRLTGRVRPNFTLTLVMGVISLLAQASTGNEALQDNRTLTQLGERLFFDKRLSADGTTSCASCHRPDLALTDGLPVSVGVNRQEGTRNAPSLLNVAEHKSFSWDGRQPTLLQQVVVPFLNAREHGLSSADALVQLVADDGGYRDAFAVAFPEVGITPRTIASAIELYVKSLTPGPSRFDRYWVLGQRSALSAAELRGFELFRGRAQCVVCHAVPKDEASFTDNKFHSVSVGIAKLGPRLAEAAKVSMSASESVRASLITSDSQIAALGRFNVSLTVADIGKYRTPSLRNVGVTAPYMHDGSVATLEEAVDLELYYRGSQIGRPVILTARERADVVAFLRALTAETLESRRANR